MSADPRSELGPQANADLGALVDDFIRGEHDVVVAMRQAFGPDSAGSRGSERLACERRHREFVELDKSVRSIVQADASGAIALTALPALPETRRYFNTLEQQYLEAKGRGLQAYLQALANLVPSDRAEEARICWVPP